MLQKLDLFGPDSDDEQEVRPGPVTLLSYAERRAVVAMKLAALREERRKRIEEEEAAEAMKVPCLPHDPPGPSVPHLSPVRAPAQVLPTLVSSIFF